MNSKELKAVLKKLGACDRGIAAVGRKGFKAAWAAAEQEDREWLVRRMPTLAPLWDKYEADRDELRAKYEADKNALWDKYQSDVDALLAKYRADGAPLRDKYEADKDALLAKYRADRAPLWAKHDADVAPLLAKYSADRDALWAAIFNIDVVEAALAAM